MCSFNSLALLWNMWLRDLHLALEFWHGFGTHGRVVGWVVWLSFDVWNKSVEWWAHGFELVVEFCGSWALICGATCLWTCDWVVWHLWLSCVDLEFLTKCWVMDMWLWTCGWVLWLLSFALWSNLPLDIWLSCVDLDLWWFVEQLVEWWTFFFGYVDELCGSYLWCTGWVLNLWLSCVALELWFVAQMVEWGTFGFEFVVELCGSWVLTCRTSGWVMTLEYWLGISLHWEMSPG